MTRAGQSSDELVDFINLLDLNGYHISTGQYIAAQKLLIMVAATSSDLLTKPQRLSNLLAPVFCISREEQEAFPRLFEVWLKTNPVLFVGQHRIENEDPPKSLVSTQNKKSEKRFRSTHIMSLRWLLALGLVIAVILLPLLIGDTPPEVTQSSPSFGRKLLSVLRENGILLAGAILFLGVLMVWSRRLSHRLELKKWRSKKRPRLDHLPVKGISELMGRILPLRRTAQALRRYRQYSAHDLDVQQTTEQTLRRGIFTPTYTPRKSLSEYLVLIDRANFKDHQARLVSEMIERLMKNGVFMERYYFQGDPRVCRKHDRKAPYETLEHVATQFPDHYLIVFTNAEGFFSPVTGHPAHWLKMFSPWETRVLLTPEYQAGGFREWALSASGFRVLPASQAGIVALSETIYSAPKQNAVASAAKALPGVLSTAVDRWLEDHPPAPATIEELCGQLRKFLGDEGYFWLGACAVYPSLQWDLTLYLGFKLVKHDNFIEKLSTLMRLPWFRYGSMPDWLRARLIVELSPYQEQSIRGVLEELLLTALLHPEGFNLLVGLEPAEEAEESFLQRTWRKFWSVERERKRFILENIQSESDDSVLHDYVLLSFLVGRRSNLLAVRVPNELRHILSSPKTSTKLKQALRRLFDISLKGFERLFDVYRKAFRRLSDVCLVTFRSLQNRFSHQGWLMPGLMTMILVVVASITTSERAVLLSLHGVNLVIFAVSLIFAARRVFRRRNRYNAWVLPFAYFSFGSWLFWVLQYVILVGGPLISSPNGFLQNAILWLGLMQNALWTTAILSLYSNLFSRVSLTLPFLVMFSIVVAVVIASQPTIMNSAAFVIIGGVSAAAIFTVLAVSIMQMPVSKISAAIFFIHGYFHWLWHYIAFTSLSQIQFVRFAFPVWHFALLGTWIALISEMLLTTRVMISSTVDDLAQEREAVERALSTLNPEEFRVETIRSHPYTPKALCALWAEQCNILILIIGERYGHVIEPEGISVIEFEYRVAYAQNPQKILVYVKDGVTREPRLNAFLRRLQEFDHGHFRSVFTTPENLCEAIQRDVALWLLSEIKEKKPQLAVADVSDDVRPS